MTVRVPLPWRDMVMVVLLSIVGVSDGSFTCTLCCLVKQIDQRMLLYVVIPVVYTVVWLLFGFILGCWRGQKTRYFRVRFLVWYTHQPRPEGFEQAPSGRHWVDVGSSRPTNGRELPNAELAKALHDKRNFTESSVKFTRSEWKQFKVEALEKDEFILVIVDNLGERFYKPAPTKESRQLQKGQWCRIYHTQGTWHRPRYDSKGWDTEKKMFPLISTGLEWAFYYVWGGASTEGSSQRNLLHSEKPAKVALRFKWVVFRLWPLVYNDSALDMLPFVIWGLYLTAPFIAQNASQVLFEPENSSFCDHQDSSAIDSLDRLTSICSDRVVTYARAAFGLYGIAVPVLLGALLVENARGIRCEPQLRMLPMRLLRRKCRVEVTCPNTPLSQTRGHHEDISGDLVRSTNHHEPYIARNSHARSYSEGGTPPNPTNTHTLIGTSYPTQATLQRL